MHRLCRVEEEMKKFEPHLKAIIGWSLFLLSILFYTENIAPSIAWRDSPEFVAVSQNLDISHPAGSPTYSLASKPFTFIPFGNIALRVNFFSSLASSACIVFIFFLMCEILNSYATYLRLIASTASALSLLSSQAFWNFSEIAEVYTFQNFFLILLLIFLVKSHSSSLFVRLRYHYCFAFLYGISLGVHASMIIFSPAFLLYLFMRASSNLNVRYLSFSLLFAILGFSAYLYLPIRSLSLLPFDWGNPETFYQFLSQIFNQKDSSNTSDYLFNISIFKSSLYLNHLVNEFSLLLFLIGIVGLVGFFLLDYKIAILLSFISISNIIFFLNAGWTVSWGYIPSFVIFILFTGKGILVSCNLFTLLDRRFIFFKFSKILSIFLFISTSLSIFSLLNKNISLDIKYDYSSEYFSKKMLSELPNDAIVFCEYMWFPLIYMQQVEKRRPDITIFLQGEIFYPEYFETISKERFPNISHPNLSRTDNYSTQGFFWELSKLNANKHPLFLEPDGQFQNLALNHLIPEKILFSFDPYNKKKISYQEIEHHKQYLYELEKESLKWIKNEEGQHIVTNKLNYIANYWDKLNHIDTALDVFDIATRIWPNGDNLHHNYGAFLLTNERLNESIVHLKKSYDISPYQISVYKNIANIMLRVEQYDSAYAMLYHAKKNFPGKNKDLSALLGATYTEMGNCENAIKLLKSSSESIQSDFDKHLEVEKYERKLRWINQYQELCFESLMGS